MMEVPDKGPVRVLEKQIKKFDRENNLEIMAIQTPNICNITKEMDSWLGCEFGSLINSLVSLPDSEKSTVHAGMQTTMPQFRGVPTNEWTRPSWRHHDCDYDHD